MSSFSSFTFSVFALSFILPLHIVTAVTPLFHFCPNSQNFTSNSRYEQNLDRLLGDLYLKTPLTGFGQVSSGYYYDNERAFGISLCRGDVLAEECRTCVADATNEIHKQCPYKKDAYIWYDSCFLKYSNTEFFGQIDNQVKFYLINVNSVNDSQSFNLKTKKLLTHLSGKASFSPKKYATGATELKELQKIYGMVQCSRDISRVDCKKCLDDAVNQLPSCCDGKQGGRVIGGSCSIRYETYKFYNASHIIY